LFYFYPKLKENMRIFFTLLFVASFLSLSGQARDPLDRAEQLALQQDYATSSYILNTFQKRHPGRLYDLARAWWLLSYNYMKTGNYQEAQEANQKSLDIRNQLFSENIAENYMRAGSISILQGNYEKALSQLFVAKSLPLGEISLYAFIDAYIASAYLELDNYPKALQYYSESLETFKIEFGEIHPDISTSYYNIGRVYAKKGELITAENNYKKSLEIEGQISNFENERSAEAYNALGLISIDDQAILYFSKARDIFKEIYGKYHPEMARTSLNLAHTLLKTEYISGAKEMLVVAEQSLFPSWRGTSFEEEPSLEMVCLDRRLFARSQSLKALIRLTEHENSTHHYLLEKALINCDNSIQAVEEQLDLMNTDGSRLDLLKEISFIYEIAIRVSTKMYRLFSKPAHAQMAFSYSEKAKANIIRANSLFSVRNDDPLNANLSQEASVLKKAIREVEAKILFAPADPAPKAEYLSLLSIFDSFKEKVKLLSPDLYLQWYQKSVASPSELQKRLANDEALISYFLGSENYYIFCITQEHFEIISQSVYKLKKEKEKANLKNIINKTGKTFGDEIGIYTKLDLPIKLPDLRKAIDGYLIAIKKVNGQKFKFYSGLLYNNLIHPLSPFLKNKKSLIIIPHDKLSHMPFEALLTEAPENKKIKYHKLSYLIKDYAISYHHSASLFLDARKSVSDYSSMDFLGLAPVFDKEKNEGYIWSSHDFIFDTSYQSTIAIRSIAPDGKNFSALPKSEHEVLKIAGLFANSKHASKAFVHNQASEKQLKLLSPSYAIIHLATHSFINFKTPSLSGIVLSQSSASHENEDGILYSSEIQAMEINARLVTLSSCESGTGPIAKGEGVLSLSKSFLQAGAKNVVSSLWKVYDNFTHQLMISFYEETLKENELKEALQKAKLQMIRQKESAAPKKWSAFILLGDGK